MILKAEYDSKTGFARNLRVNFDYESRTVTFEVTCDDGDNYTKCTFTDFDEALNAYNALMEETK